MSFVFFVDQLRFLGLWWSGNQDIHFASVSISADLSSLNGKNYPTGFFSPDLGVGIKIQNVLATGTRSDPGQFVFLVPAAVPVPAAVWLFTSGFGLLAFSGRRIAQGDQLQYC